LLWWGFWQNRGSLSIGCFCSRSLSTLTFVAPR
jgi:hypothetical protein